MSRKLPGVDDPHRWLSFAKSDLRLAQKGRLPEVRLEGLCYLAQQAAEKALKALLLQRGIPFPKTHQIQALISHLPADLAPPPSVKQAADLSDYALEGRYPQTFEDVTEKEYQQALKKSEAVVNWAEKAIRNSGGPRGQSEAHEAQAVYKVGKSRRKKRKGK